MRSFSVLAGVSLSILSILGVTTVTTSARADGYTVRGRGRVVYEDGSNKPLAGARVQLMDQDVDFDEVMKRGRTDANGDYDLTGTAEDAWTVCDGCDHPDPYIKVILYDPNRVDVHNIWGFTHFGLTDTREDKAGTINFGTWQFDDDEALYPRLFGITQSIYSKFLDLTGESRVPGNDGVVGIQVPEVIQFGVPWTGVDAIHWPSSYGDYKALYHEFGHRLRHGVDGSESHFLNDAILFTYARSHSMDLHSNLGFAFNEGWAEYHASLYDNDARERLQEWEMKAHEDEVEGNVARKLFLLSTRCGGFRPMWNALKSGTNKSIDGGPPAAQTGIHSFAQFNTWFKGQNPKCIEINPNLAKNLGRRPISQLKALDFAAQTKSLVKALDKIDARAPSLVKIKWDSARIAKLPAPIQAPMRRVTDKRVALAKAHELKFRTAVRAATLALPAATEKSATDGSFDKAVDKAREDLKKTLAEPRLKQIAEIKQDIDRERKATSDRRFQTYLDRMTARYTAQETEIRASLARPGSPIPESLIPRSAAAPTKKTAP